MLGSPWGIEDAGCPGRPNPAVPTWHSRARFRFQVGLADDMIGYEIPAWAFSGIPGLFANSPPYADGCVNDGDDHDPAGHPHKLESEGVGPTASNTLANLLAGLLDADAGAHPGAPRPLIRPGRFVLADGSLTRRASRAVAIWLVDPGSQRLGPGEGTIVSLPGVGPFGTREPDATGFFTDYDGARQRRPGIATRGMRAGKRQYYVDVFPALETVPLTPPAPRPTG